MSSKSNRPWKAMKLHSLILKRLYLLHVFVKLWSCVTPVLFIFACLLYTDVSQKRDLDLNENTCLNKGFNNNICSLCQLAIAIAQEGFCIGFFFFSFFVSHINAIFVDQQICLCAIWSTSWKWKSRFSDCSFDTLEKIQSPEAHKYKYWKW